MVFLIVREIFKDTYSQTAKCKNGSKFWQLWDGELKWDLERAPSARKGSSVFFVFMVVMLVCNPGPKGG